MGVYTKAEEVEILKENGLLVSKTLGVIAEHIKEGVTTNRLDQIAEEFIRDHGAMPGFLGYNKYPKTLCTSVNNQVVHGIPSDTVLKEGDIVSIDVGTKLKGFYGDSAYTFALGEVSPDVRKLLRVTRESLFKGIDAAVEGNRIGDIGFAVQSHCEANELSVVREMVGHGLGRNLHESPEVPNYGKRGHGTKLQNGLVLCIEPMINLGRKEIFQEKDGWTIRTKDNRPSAHFELTIIVRKGNPEVISTFEFVEKVYKGII